MHMEGTIHMVFLEWHELYKSHWQFALRTQRC
jgi:hypothetical protein